MYLSKSCELAVQAVLYLAGQKGDDFVSIKQISAEKDIPFHFLGKILQKLTQQNLLDSHKGPRGGVRLARPAHQITIYEIVEAIDGLDRFNRCVIGLPDCGGDKPCELHEQWSEIRNGVIEMFKNMTISQLVHH